MDSWCEFQATFYTLILQTRKQALRLCYTVNNRPFDRGKKMVTLDLKLELPESLLREAKLAGLLSPASIEKMLLKEVKHQRINKLFESADRLAKIDMPSLSMAEVETEIATLRAK